MIVKVDGAGQRPLCVLFVVSRTWASAGMMQLGGVVQIMGSDSVCVVLGGGELG